MFRIDDILNNSKTQNVTSIWKWQEDLCLRVLLLQLQLRNTGLALAVDSSFSSSQTKEWYAGDKYGDEENFIDNNGEEIYTI